MNNPLQQFAQERKLAPGELAKRLNMSTRHVYRLLNGEYPITDSFIGSFARAFGFDVAAEIFGQTETERAGGTPEAFPPIVHQPTPTCHGTKGLEAAA